MTLECPPGFIFIKKVHYLCLSFLEDNSFVDWLVKERLVANKLKEKRRKKNIWFKKEMVEIKGYLIRYGIFKPKITVPSNLTFNLT